MAKLFSIEPASARVLVGQVAEGDEDDPGLVRHRDGGAAHLDRLQGVLDLEEAPVRRENGARAVVGHLSRLHLHRYPSSRVRARPIEGGI